MNGTLLLQISGWAIGSAVALLLIPGTCKLLRSPLETAFRAASDGKTEFESSVSVIVAARDEGETIEKTIRSILASDVPELEVIAIDDRSSDETGAVLDVIAADDSRLTVLHVDELPVGWMGKNHALQLGQQVATGKWLLFTDADIEFAADTIRKAIAVTEHRRLDHLCLVPNHARSGLLEEAIVGGFFQMFVVGSQPWLIPTRFLHSYVGVGAFNLIRRETYDRVGQHEPLALEVLDDFMLGRMVKFAGGRQDALLAQNGLRFRWQNSAWGVIRGLEKNAFAGAGYSWLQTVLGSAVLATLWVMPMAVLPLMIIRPDALRWCIGFGIALTIIHITFALFAMMSGLRKRTALLAIPGVLCILFAWWRSAILTTRQGGVRWRETFYPLKQVREARRKFRAYLQSLRQPIK